MIDYIKKTKKQELYVVNFFFRYLQVYLTLQKGFTRAYESLKNVLANLAMVFQNLQAQQNFHWPWPVGRGLS